MSNKELESARKELSKRILLNKKLAAVRSRELMILELKKKNFCMYDILIKAARLYPL